MPSWLRGRLLALIAVLVLVSGAALYLQGWQGWKNSGEAPRPSLLQTKIDEPAFQSTATAAERYDLAQRTAAELVRDYPDDPAALSVQARRHFLLVETDQAIALWRKCLEMDPNFADAYFGLGAVAMDRGEYQQAIERFEDVARLDPEDPRVPVLLAQSFMRAGRPEDAILVLEQHISTEQTSAEAWELLGEAHLQVQRFDRALHCFEVALEAVPTMESAVFGLSRAYAGLGDSEKAQAYAERYRKLSGSLNEDAGEAKGVHELQESARIAAQTYADAARVRQRHGESQRAEDFLLRAVLLQPENTQFLAQLQRSLQRRGAYAEAAQVGERIVELAPNQLDQWLNLGWLYANLDQSEQAVAACQKAIALNPQDPRCRRAYEVIQRLQ